MNYVEFPFNYMYISAKLTSLPKRKHKIIMHIPDNSTLVHVKSGTQTDVCYDNAIIGRSSPQ